MVIKKYIMVLLVLLVFFVPAKAQEFEQAVQKGDLVKVKALLKKRPETSHR